MANSKFNTRVFRKACQKTRIYEFAMQSLRRSTSAALILHNSFIINACTRMPHTKNRRVPTTGTLRYPLSALDGVARQHLHQTRWPVDVRTSNNREAGLPGGMSSGILRRACGCATSATPIVGRQLGGAAVRGGVGLEGAGGECSGTDGAGQNKFRGRRK